jgi:hypothetical protein
MRAGIPPDDVVQTVVQDEAVLLDDHRAPAENGPPFEDEDARAIMGQQRTRGQPGETAANHDNVKSVSHYQPKELFTAHKNQISIILD